MTIELVPDGCWRGNLRSQLPPALWDVVRRDAYKRAHGRCSVCGATGRLEAHEKWSYDEARALQRLEDVVALCRDCHEVKHIARAQMMGRGMDVMEHFMKVNKCTQSDYHAALAEANEEHKRRNRIEDWTTDMLTWLKQRFDF